MCARAVMSTAEPPPRPTPPPPPPPPPQTRSRTGAPGMAGTIAKATFVRKCHALVGALRRQGWREQPKAAPTHTPGRKETPPMCAQAGGSRREPHRKRMPMILRGASRSPPTRAVSDSATMSGIGLPMTTLLFSKAESTTACDSLATMSQLSHRHRGAISRAPFAPRGPAQRCRRIPSRSLAQRVGTTRGRRPKRRARCCTRARPSS